MAIAEFLELMLEKYQERIAKDLNEFKFELEADTPGITEGIEKGVFYFYSLGHSEVWLYRNFLFQNCAKR